MKRTSAREAGTFDEGQNIADGTATRIPQGGSTAVTLINRQRQALSDLRHLLRSFLDEKLDVVDFLPEYRKLFAPFDPPDLVSKGLSPQELVELETLIEIAGGWFGESEDIHVPRRSDWRYGVDTGAYSWIDVSAYRLRIRELLEQQGLKLG